MSFNNESYKDKKSLVIYFSRADENYSVGYITKGNTEVIAEYIKDIINADLFKVEPKNSYSKDYDTCIKEAKERQTSHNAPIIESVPNINNYEVIYIGAPVYWSYMPEEMVTALKDIDFTNKIIRVFTTHEGSGLGSIPTQVKQICKGAQVLDDSIAIYGSHVNTSKDEIEKWL